MTGERTQQNIELVINGWLRPLAARDVDTLRQHLQPDVVWQGVTSDVACRSRDELLDFVSDRDAIDRRVERLDLVGSDDHVIVGVRGDGLDEVAGVRLDGQIFFVITIRDGRIARIDDHPTRAAALAAAGMDGRTGAETGGHDVHICPSDRGRPRPAPGGGRRRRRDRGGATR